MLKKLFAFLFGRKKPAPPPARRSTGQARDTLSQFRDSRPRDFADGGYTGNPAHTLDSLSLHNQHHSEPAGCGAHSRSSSYESSGYGSCSSSSDSSSSSSDSGSSSSD